MVTVRPKGDHCDMSDDDLMMVTIGPKDGHCDMSDDDLIADDGYSGTKRWSL